MTLELTPEQRDILIAAVQIRLDGNNAAAGYLWDAAQSIRDTLAAENQSLHTLIGHLKNAPTIILHRP